MSKPNFKNDLAFGQTGEALMEQFFPGCTKLDGRKADFILADGSRLELKTERRRLSETENFFIERWSDVDRAKAGGPWTAKVNGCKFYAHLFIKDGVLFVFETEKLLEFLEAQRYSDIRIQNRSWITIGWKVGRSSVEHLFEQRKLDDIG